MLYKAEELRGYAFHSRDGKTGTIEDLYFDDRFWTVRYLVVDTGGWLVQKRMLVSPRALSGVDRDTKTIESILTKAQMERSPAPDEHPPVSRQFEIAYNEYYGYSPYWVGPFAWGTLTAPLPPEAAVSLEERASWDSNLYSAKDVAGFGGYSVTATDGEVGRITDLLLSAEDWAIRYLVIDTRGWFSSKHVLLPPQWTTVDWEHFTLSVEMTREAIKGAPAYDVDAPVTREYETELYSHYCRQAYWSDDAICYDPPRARPPDSD